MVAIRICAPIDPPHTILFVTFLGEVGESEPGRLLLVIRSDQALAVAVLAPHAEAVRVGAPPRLHAKAGLDARDHVRARGVASAAAAQASVAVRVPPREVQKVDAREGDEEAANQ
jgi:hypothetical protein